MAGYDSRALVAAAVGGAGSSWVLSNQSPDASRSSPLWLQCFKWMVRKADPSIPDLYLPEDYYERTYHDDEEAWYHYLGQTSVPAHLLFAAFSAGWAARGQWPLLRRLVGAVAEAVVTPQHRRRQGRTQQSHSPTTASAGDIAALVRELAEGGEAARVAAAQQMAQRTGNGGRSSGRSGPRSSNNRA